MSNDNDEKSEYVLVFEGEQGRGSLLVEYHHPKPEPPSILKEEWLQEISKDARKLGYIGLQHLAFVMAAEEIYTDLLLDLWEKYECDLRNPKDPRRETARDRVGIWYTLFERWIFRRVEGGTHEFKVNVLAPETFKYDKDKGRMIRSDSGDFIGLQELGELLAYRIGIPLPTMLYSKEEFDGNVGMLKSDHRNEKGGDPEPEMEPDQEWLHLS